MKQMGYLRAEGIKGKAQRGSASTLALPLTSCVTTETQGGFSETQFPFGKIENNSPEAAVTVSPWHTSEDQQEEKAPAHGA